MISSSRQSGSSPLAASAADTASGSPGSTIWRAETLTEMVSGSPSSPAFQLAACSQASSSTQRPIGTISPVSSASGMKSSGRTMAPSRCQRSSASKPMVRRDGSSTIGW